MNKEIVSFIKKVQAISQTGLSFSKDPYALENYEELMEMSIDLLSKMTDNPINTCKLYDHYMYPVAQPAVRIMITNEKSEILMVKEKEDGKWTIPGGWCDIGESPKENAIKEVSQETGYDIEIKRLLGLFDRNKYIEHVSRFDVYDIMFYAKIIGGSINPNHEVIEVKWFDINELPELSRKTSLDELEIAYDVLKNNKATYFD